MYQSFLKPIIDYLLAVILLLMVIPIGLLISILLLFTGDNKIFFIQWRPGLGRKLFPLIKFRSMMDSYNESGELLPDEMRITRIGKFLRATSLDELPQLINVLSGEMSLVGPRPLLPEYLELYSVRHLRRNQVKPGITGLAQVNGRSAIPWSERLEMDVQYVEKISLSLDLSIIFTTLLKLFSAREINAIDSNSIPKFTGY